LVKTQGRARIRWREAGVLTVSSSDTNRWQVSFAPANAVRSNYEIHAVLLAGDLVLTSKQAKRGRQLHHDFVALAS